MGSSHPNIAPYGTIYATADGKELVFAVGTDKQFATLCEVLGLRGASENLLSDDERPPPFQIALNRTEP